MTMTVLVLWVLVARAVCQLTARAIDKDAPPGSEEDAAPLPVPWMWLPMEAGGTDVASTSNSPPEVILPPHQPVAYDHPDMHCPDTHESAGVYCRRRGLDRRDRGFVNKCVPKLQDGLVCWKGKVLGKPGACPLGTRCFPLGNKPNLKGRWSPRKRPLSERPQIECVPLEFYLPPLKRPMLADAVARDHIIAQMEAAQAVNTEQTVAAPYTVPQAGEVRVNTGPWEPRPRTAVVELDLLHGPSRQDIARIDPYPRPPDLDDLRDWGLSLELGRVGDCEPKS